MHKRYPCMNGRRRKHYFGSNRCSAGSAHPSHYIMMGQPPQNTCLWCGFNKETKEYTDRRYRKDVPCPFKGFAIECKKCELKTDDPTFEECTFVKFKRHRYDRE